MSEVTNNLSDIISSQEKDLGSPNSSPEENIQEVKYTSSLPKIKKVPAKLVVVSQIAHVRTEQKLGDQPTVRTPNFGRALESDNYPFIIPRIKLTQEWKQVDSSWVEKDKCSMLLISNNEGRGFTTIPHKEELEDIYKRVVEVGILTTYLVPTVDEVRAYEIQARNRTVWDTEPIQKPEPIVEITPLFYIHPTEEHPYSPRDLGKLWFRCVHGEANCTFTFYPN